MMIHRKAKPLRASSTIQDVGLILLPKQEFLCSPHPYSSVLDNGRISLNAVSQMSFYFPLTHKMSHLTGSRFLRSSEMVDLSTSFKLPAMRPSWTTTGRTLLVDQPHLSVWLAVYAGHLETYQLHSILATSPRCVYGEFPSRRTRWCLL